MYHASLATGFTNFPVISSLALMYYGGIKIPAKVGKTMIEPTTYHGILLPHLVLILSLPSPATGVITPSVICPESTQYPVTVSLNPMTLLMYHVKYKNHMLAHKSLKTCPTE